VRKNPTASPRHHRLRRGDKFLAQGLLNQAISEYSHAVEATPGNWVAVGTLADLLLRAGDIERAIEQYLRIADYLHSHGVLPKAAAVYGRILKLRPDVEHAQMRSADISVVQGSLVEAKRLLTAVAASRLGRGDRHGAIEILHRIGELDPDDLAAGVAAPVAGGAIGDTQVAIERLVSLSDRFRQRGDLAGSLGALEEAARLDAENTAVVGALVALCIETGELDRAVGYASGSREFRTIAAALMAADRPADALAVLEQALERDPSDDETRLLIVRERIRTGDLDGARARLPGDPSQPDLLLCRAEIELLSGNAGGVRTLAQRVIAADPARRGELIQLGLRLGERAADAAFECVDVGTDAALEEHNWSDAASALHEFVVAVPPHVPALMKLVEVCVDGRLDEMLHDTQARLAEVYLLAGRAGEARVIAEDLLVHEPSKPANVERLRRALTLLGESDPDACIAEQLNADPVSAMFGDPGGAAVRAPAAPEALSAPTVRTEDKAPATSESRSPRKDTRGGKPRPGRVPAATEQYRDALGLCKAGRTEEAIAALKEAVRSPRHRFESARLLATIYCEGGKLHDAIEWYERATQASPGPEATHDVLYDLGCTLVTAGESDRALAIFLELQAEAPGYRDVSKQLEGLLRRARG
jgi:tetratricopeptide (TPR) repeat protein